MKIFIGCSMNDNITEDLYESSKELLEIILAENDLVFGASNTGLMGLSYSIAKKNDKEIIGICPEIYKDDFKNLNVSHEITTTNISERMEKIISFSDALLFLPGGYGTLYEFFAAVEMKRGKEFDLPIIIYCDKLCNYFNELISFLSITMKENNFASSKEESNYFIATSPNEVMDILSNYEKERTHEYKR